MYAFDDHGNVLIDTDKTDLIAAASRNRTISKRAYALSQLQYTPFNPVTGATWNIFLTRLNEMYRSLWRNMKSPVRNTAIPNLRGPGDFTSLYTKIITDWVSNDLTGFKGPLPVAELNGLKTLAFFVPADGAVIRYLGRLQQKAQGLFDISVGRCEDMGGRVTTLDGSSASITRGENCMVIQVTEKFNVGLTGRFEGSVSTLRGIQQVMKIDKVVDSLNKVTTTLSRKLMSQDGSWGETSRFPITNFSRKVVDLRIFNRTGLISLEDIHTQFHGNRPSLYGDRAVYDMVALEDRQPFTQTVTGNGEHKWTQPRS